MKFRKIMESKKAKIIAAVCIAHMVVIISGAAVIGAHTGGFACGSSHGWRHGHCDGKFQEYFLAHMDECVETLNLSGSQMEGWKAIREELKSEMKSRMEKREQFISDISKEMNKETPDMEKIAAMFRQKINEVPDIASTHIDYVLEFYNLLDDDQKKQVLDKARDRLSKCHST